MSKKENDYSVDFELEKIISKSLEKHNKKKRPPTPPKTLHIFPLTRRPFFPGVATPIIIDTPYFLEALKEIANTGHQCIGFSLTKNEDCDQSKLSLNDLHRIGVYGRIMRIIPLEQGGIQVILLIEGRIEILKPVPDAPHLQATVRYHKDAPDSDLQLKAYSVSIISTMKELLKLNPLFKEELQLFMGHSHSVEPGKLADFAVAMTTATRDEMQEVLDCLEVQARIDKALILLKKELDISLLQNNINKQIDSAISKTQKDFFLREQLKTIKKELGIERDDRVLDRQKFETRIQERKIPQDVLNVITEELDKLTALDTHSAEYAVARGYVDWLTVIPWGIKSEECLDLDIAKQVLDEDHYGLPDIKERILEFIGVGKLVGGVKGSIICLVGPPGVGKTSIGRSIARALNRQFYRFSVGGMRDEAEIKGHRRTYIGAMPGKIIQALKFCKTMNPVIMIDEVDKLSNSYHGDPAAALLEVLDPEQNIDFLDHYLDVRADLSDVLFIITANVLDTIPEPLKDRMDILRLSGYIMEEKIEIAKKYLIPRNRKLMGIKTTQAQFHESALRMIINGYARESGVRTLENLIKKILRKVAVEIVEAERKPKKTKIHDKPLQRWAITANTLPKYLGKPLYTTDRFYETNPIGVATGLAWTAMGGATLYIEAIKVPSAKTEMKLTGQAGQVMKESSEIAWSYLHSAMTKYAPDYTFFAKNQVHIHIPEGATPKDGPSAGVTMVTALISLLTNTPVKENLGMSGEITLTGRVLPIGGVKEKLVASRRSGLVELIFPSENQRDYDELPEYLKEDLIVHFVNHYDEVFKIAFPKDL